MGVLELFSVDDHVVEPADVWSSRVPAKFRDGAPHVIEEDGREFWVYEDQRSLTMGLNSVAGKPREQWGLEPARFSDMIPGSYDPKERARDLLANGVLASVNFPSLPGFGGRLFAQFKDKELADACVRAWNDFILDEWVPGGPPGMFVPMVICQLWDPELAEAEIRRCVSKGAKALCFVENPSPMGLPSFWTDFWDPIWAVAEETDLPVCMHVGSSGYTPIQSSDSNFLEPIAIGMIGALMGSINLMLAPPAYKFPKLKLVWSEGGIGWIPAALERADRQFERHNYWAKAGDTKPSEIFHRNMWVCMIEEPVGLSFREHVGVDKILWECDYPHADTPWPHAQKAAEELFAGVPAAEVAAITHGNAEQLFSWTMADPALVTSPDIASWSSTLAGNPYAAMDRRHDVEGVEHARPVPAHAGDPCRHTVQDNNMFKACGQPISADGTCAAGHLTAFVNA
jgi:predicted TIM-barrel fold metal-dependent hydrolase